MSVVIVGGHECMERQYRNICKNFGCKSKIFCKYKADMQDRVGKPDLLILFTHTVSHKAVRCAVSGVPKSTNIVWSHSSSRSALYNILNTNIRN
ncbi:MAG: DUF2325 domain-containing protein [Bacillota bacterium]|nr:DUF2325 domain-containing protein [Bacillota bacterium]